MNEAVENVTENTEVTSKQEETKAEKFIRLGEYRMNKAMDAIGRLSILPTNQLMNTHRSRWKPCSLRWSYGWQM